MPIAARYRGPDPHEVDDVVQEIRRLELLMKRWAEGPPILLAVGRGHATPAELVPGGSDEIWLMQLPHGSVPCVGIVNSVGGFRAAVR